ncbi:hypothetical protein [Lysinibacillus sp. NPDC047702]|uniref:hypothetical protein n=1 Tax=unclassified Lysinibacillus TaxID=2636778 RepID=UPI003CFF252E
MNQIIINKLILLGPNYKRTLYFEKGLTIIRGDRTTGKSLVLSLIDYCFGKSEGIILKVQKELDEHCDQVFLEISINEEVLTLNRSLKQKPSKIAFYFCDFESINDYIPKISDIKEAMEIIMRKLKISEYKRTKYKVHSNEQELETISFRDIFRYVYLKQHLLGTDNFLDNNTTFKRNKNPYAFEMIFGLVEPDKDQLNLQLVNAKNNIEAKKREITGLNSYLIDKEADDIFALMSTAEKIKAEINEQKKEKEVILNKSSQVNNKENEMYIKLKSRLTEVANQIFNCNKQKSDLELSIRSKKFLVSEYEKENLDTNATIEINYHLIVEEQKIECPLCHSMVHTHIGQKSKPALEVLRKVKREIESKIKLVNNLIEKDRCTIDQIDKELSSLKNEKEILDNAIKKFAKKTSVPFLSQLDSLNSIINAHNKKKEIVDECIRIHRKIEEKERQVEEFKKEVERLEKELKNLKVSELRKSEIFSFLNKKYKSYMNRLKYDTKDTYIDPENYMPYHNGASVFEHESGGLLECMQISYLAAILTSKKEGFAIGHPGILLLDSLSKYIGTIKEEAKGKEKEDSQKINDPEVYDEIYKVLIELCKDFQIIVVDNTPPNLVSSLVKYTFYSGEGLVNLGVNEF